MPIPFPRNVDELLLAVIAAGVQLAEQDKAKIRQNVIDTDAEADAAMGGARDRGEIARQRLNDQ